MIQIASNILRSKNDSCIARLSIFFESVIEKSSTFCRGNGSRHKADFMCKAICPKQVADLQNCRTDCGQVFAADEYDVTGGEEC